MRKISRKALAGVVVAILSLISVAFSVVVYQLQIDNSMKLVESYHLQLKQADGTTAINSYAWGDFEEGQTKRMYEVDSYSAELWNIGNTEVNVTWSSDIPSEWSISLECTYTTNFSAWPSGETKALGLETFNPLKLKIYLSEVSATPNIDYTFTLSFDIIE